MIYGAEILNEGSGVSIDDAVTEMQATFVARFAEPWQHQMLRDENDFSFPAGGEASADGLNGISGRRSIYLER